MMQRIGYVILILLLINGYSHAQHVSVMIGSGIGTYSMGNLKELNRQMIYGMPVKPELVNNFPPFPYYKFSAYWEYRKIGIGLSVAHYSTGSRIHYSDYTGSMSIKQLIRGNSVSLPFKVRLTQNEQLNFFFHIEPGYAMTIDRISESMTLLGESYRSEYNFESESYFLVPGISCSYYKGKFHLATVLGYLIDTGGNLHAEGNADMEIVDNYNKSIKTNLSGFRLEITMGIRFPVKFGAGVTRQPRERQKFNFWDWMFMYRPVPAPRPF